MRFESLLTMRYIKSQKRHSALTICSIAISVALMTLIFTAYSTYEGINRDRLLLNSPFHMAFCHITEEQADGIQNFSGVKSSDVMTNKDGTNTVTINFKKKGIGDENEFEQQLAKTLGITEEKLQKSIHGTYEGINLNLEKYTDFTIIENYELMEADLVTDKAMFNKLATICIVFLGAVIFALMLRFIIDTAFEISSKEREKQFGILQSIGAEPKQIVRIITFEGLFLSVIGVPVGLILGTGVTFAAFCYIVGSGKMDIFFTQEVADKILHFHADPLMLLISALTGLCWVLLSAYGTGMRVIKMSPVEAISGRAKKVTKVRKRSVLGLIFGLSGKLASRNARRQKKRFIITIISLTLSFALFAGTSCIMNCYSEFVSSMYSEFGGDFCIILNYSKTQPLSFCEQIEHIQQSGFFKDLDYAVSKSLINTNLNNGKEIRVNYVSEYAYNLNFFGEPPISYDELLASGKYLLTVSGDLPMTDADKVSGKITKSDFSENKGNSSGNQPKRTYTEHTFNLIDCVKLPSPSERGGIYSLMGEMYIENPYYILLAPIECFSARDYKLYGKSPSVSYLDCNLADGESHEEAVEYIRRNEEISDYEDFYAEAEKSRSYLAIIRICAEIVIVLLSIVAAVNMINIISTGILNRKSEISAMQCVGMTEGQLYKMIIVECIEYTLFAAIAASILCVLAIWGTEQFLISVQLFNTESVGTLIDYKEPVIKILLASAFALIISILAGIIPLRIMQKDSLVERIRSVE